MVVEDVVISNEKQEPGLVQFDLNIKNKDSKTFLIC